MPRKSKRRRTGSSPSTSTSTSHRATKSSSSSTKTEGESSLGATSTDTAKLSPEQHMLQYLPYNASVFCGMSVGDEIPPKGLPARYCLNEIKDIHTLDFNETLNTSSYVNVVAEPEEEEAALIGLKINLADQTVYPQSFKIHNSCVSMIAKLWNCPEPSSGVYAGAGTVGSTEACLLAGLALKFRWREWYRKKEKMDAEEVLGTRPNLVISTLFQACWEKFFRYMDVVPRLITPKIGQFNLDYEQLEEAIDDTTIGVVCIMGNHYGGQYDEVKKVDEVVRTVNRAKKLQVGVHVDAASGGFIAPFQDVPAWDFRLENVLSISSSGHKFGESCCGTGWIVWREREDLSEHVSVSVSYLGGNADSYTLNFSRPASGIYNQYYKLLRYGIEGYELVCSNMMANADYIRAELSKIKVRDIDIFEILDDGNSGCLPVVAARLNPKLSLPYDDIDLQYVLSIGHWYVSGYKLQFEHPLSKKESPLFSDVDKDSTMFRVVVKSSLTRRLAENLVQNFRKAIEYLQAHGSGFKKLHEKQHKLSGHVHC